MTSAARAIVDSGFLVALKSRQDSYHAWSVEVSRTLPGPWLTCEACVTEAAYLLGKISVKDADGLYDLLGQGVVVSQHLLPEQFAAMRTEIDRYHGRSVDFADACLMVLSDDAPHLPIVTVDVADFAVYLRGRKNRRLVAPS